MEGMIAFNRNALWAKRAFLLLAHLWGKVWPYVLPQAPLVLRHLLFRKLLPRHTLLLRHALLPILRPKMEISLLYLVI